MSDKLFRSLNVELRIVNEQTGVVEYIASDATLDHYRDIIDPKGWKFDHFEKNAPFLNSHRSWSIEDQLGKVVDFKVVKGQLIEKVQWAKDIEENKLAALGWKMTVGGFLKAVSVGFIPVKAHWCGSKEFSEAAAALGLSVETTGQCQRIFSEQQQLELSACVIGANPSALAKAFDDGCVKDADLAAIGFADDDMHFLLTAGKAFDLPDTSEAMRLMIRREMTRITGRKTISGNPGGGTGTDAGKRAAAAEAERRAAEQRESFLKKLDALVG